MKTRDLFIENYWYQAANAPNVSTTFDQFQVARDNWNSTEELIVNSGVRQEKIDCPFPSKEAVRLYIDRKVRCKD